MSKRTVGVVIPAYNCAKYISQCISSILNQEYDDIEIIVVNDGSTDKINEVLDVVDSPLVHVINTKNNGVMIARRIGIDALNGCQYIMFIDGDDYLIGTTIMKDCVQIIERDEVDMVCFGYTSNTNKFSAYNKDINIVPQKEALKMMLIRKNVDGNLPYSLYKYEYVSREYIPRNYHRDDFLNKAAFIQSCRKIAIISQVGYFYRMNENSQTHKELKEEDFIYYTHAVGFVENLPTDLKSEGECFVRWILLWLANHLNKNNNGKKLSMYGKVMRLFRGEFPSILRDNNFTPKEHIVTILLYINLFTPVYLLRQKLKRCEKMKKRIL